jgi:hypothetical protein
MQFMKFVAYSNISLAKAREIFKSGNHFINFISHKHSFKILYISNMKQKMYYIANYTDHEAKDSVHEA